MDKQFRILCVSLFIGSLLMLDQAVADTVALPRTNSATCYDPAGQKVIACAGTGQDGDKQKGVAAPSPRYIDKDPLVIDTLTGLVWPKNVNCANVDLNHYYAYKEVWSTPQAWTDAMKSVAGFNNIGYICNIYNQPSEAPWRLPNRKEFFSMLEYYSSSQQLGQSTYWTSSTDAYNTDKAWVVKAYDGRYSSDPPFLSAVTSDYKTNLNYFWPVRNRISSD